MSARRRGSVTSGTADPTGRSVTVSMTNTVLGEMLATYKREPSAEMASSPSVPPSGMR
ncbi:MAG: hypothetical protein M3468_04330 [Acidobacteriota bacterium]|nr:hypothetical protein [Acidobacteriota bacterium]